jgi:hypothetical protein
VRGFFTVAVLVLGTSMPLVSSSISIKPAEVSVAPGQAFALDVDATAVAELYAFQFDVDFNPGVLAATSVSEGPFLPTGGSTIFVPGNIDNVGGTILTIADTLVGPIPGVNGSGTLAVIDFTALSGGTDLIALSNATFLNSALSDISVTVKSGTVTVQAVSEPASLRLLFFSAVVVTLVGIFSGPVGESLRSFIHPHENGLRALPSAE